LPVSSHTRKGHARATGSATAASSQVWRRGVRSHNVAAMPASGKIAPYSRVLAARTAKPPASKAQRLPFSSRRWDRLQTIPVTATAVRPVSCPRMTDQVSSGHAAASNTARRATIAPPQRLASRQINSCVASSCSATTGEVHSAWELPPHA
jgi:hypothetical protein